MERHYSHEFIREKIQEILTSGIDIRRAALIKAGIDQKLIPNLGTLPEEQEIDDLLSEMLINGPFTEDDGIRLFEAFVVGPYVFPGIGTDFNDQELDNFLKIAEEVSNSPMWLQGHSMYTTTEGDYIDGSKILSQHKSEYSKSELILPNTRLEIGRLSPSFKILEKLLEDNTHIEKLHWREFEELVAELLHHDGYTVQLGPGRSDGGKDIIATKEFEGLGSFMAVWQAKKLKIGNKVGIDVIRELADTRNEQKASKGIIVTSTYLTKGALERVKRDEYILGKVDKNDLTAWMKKIASRRRNN